jgi:excisionase family DNA binding protein
VTRQFLTVAEAAERYRCSAWTIREKCRRGDLPHLKPSGAKAILLPLDWLEEFELGVPVEIARTRAPRRGVPAARVVRPKREDGLS